MELFNWSWDELRGNTITQREKEKGEWKWRIYCRENERCVHSLSQYSRVIVTTLSSRVSQVLVFHAMKGWRVTQQLPLTTAVSSNVVKHDHISILSTLALGHHQSKSPNYCLVQADRMKTFGAIPEVKRMHCGGLSLNEKQINMDAKGLSQYRLLKRTTKVGEHLCYMFLRFGFYKIMGFTCTEK